MKITFICCVFPPEPEPAGVMASQLAQHLSSEGHAVSMVVPFPNRPYGRVYDGFRRCLSQVETAGENYRIVRCANWLIGKRRRHLSRLLENLTFGVTATWAAWKEGRPDVMLVETWPLLAAQLGLLLARRWKVPAFYYVQDVYPEVLECTGLVKQNGQVASGLRAWDRHLCSISSRVVVISEGMRQLLCGSRELQYDHVAVVENWVDASLFPPQARENAWREEMGISPGTFLVLYAGTLGHVSGAGVFIEVAHRLRDHENIRILCVGEGVLKKEMIGAARRDGLRNIEFKPFQPADRVAQMLGSADAMILTVQKGYSDASVPSKLISYLAAGRPVICAAPASSAVAQTVTQAGAGIVVEPGNGEAVAEAVLDLQRRRRQADEMGRNARAYFLSHFTLDRAYRQFSELLSVSTGTRALGAGQG